jgi:hypothetical protein
MWVLGGVGLVVPSTTILSINPPIACIEEPDYEWQMKEKRLLQVRDLFSPSHLFLKKKNSMSNKGWSPFTHCGWLTMVSRLGTASLTTKVVKN